MPTYQATEKARQKVLRIKEVAVSFRRERAERRQKHVFDTWEIPHLWAHKVQADARNAQGNLYFENETIYSYGTHFPIAHHVENKRGKSAVLLTTRSYSVTTSGHVSAVRCAIPRDVPVFHVYNPALSPRESLTCYVSAVSVQVQSASERKMETTRNEDVQRAVALIAECKAFCKFFGLRVPKFDALPKIDKEKLARQTKAQKDRQAAKDAARRAKWEAEQARRRAEADTWNASGICQHTPKHDAHVYGDIWKCEKQREEEEWAAKSAEIIAAWRNGDTRARLRDPWNLPVMLRVSSDGTEVETSRGARVPVSHALRGLRFVRAVVSKGETYQRNGHTLHLGHYAIDRIDVDGTLHAGCHVISLAEIERIAPTLESLPISESSQEVQS
jgi:hypothetical protein